MQGGAGHWWGKGTNRKSGDIKNTQPSNGLTGNKLVGGKGKGLCNSKKNGKGKNEG